jgi:hypothetical protein
MVAINLTNHLQINKLLYLHQYGFQRFHSTEQNLIQVVNNIGLVLRIRIEKMRMRIQEKISMRMRMRIRIHALTELWRAK